MIDINYPLFTSQFEPELIEEIKHLGIQKNYEPNLLLLEVGQAITHVPLVISGRIKVSRVDDQGHELFLYHVNPSESCAMTFSCCMQNSSSEINAETEEKSEIILISVDTMNSWICKYPSWKKYMMQSINMRFHELLRSIDQLAFKKLDERLVIYLKEQVEHSGSTIINASHEKIANDLATSRVVISRLLKNLENDNRVILYRNQIKIMRAL